jgi:hypothetical protein
MHPFMGAVVLRLDGGIRWRTMPSCIHHTFSSQSPWMPVEAKGAPLSLRIASGRPTSWNSRRNAGLAPFVFTEGSALHSKTLRLK